MKTKQKKLTDEEYNDELDKIYSQLNWLRGLLATVWIVCILSLFVCELLLILKKYGVI